MGEEGFVRSHELDRVREQLFPDLPVEEGWARIEWASRAASDPDRADAVERLVGSTDLSGDLLDILRRLRRDEPEDEPE